MSNLVLSVIENLERQYRRCDEYGNECFFKFYSSVRDGKDVVGYVLKCDNTNFLLEICREWCQTWTKYLYLGNNIIISNIPWDSDDKCAICLDSITDEHSVIVEKCKHYFHKVCLQKWLSSNNTCPVCRLIIFSNIYEAKLELSVETLSNHITEEGHFDCVYCFEHVCNNLTGIWE